MFFQKLVDKIQGMCISVFNIFFMVFFSFKQISFCYIVIFNGKLDGFYWFFWCIVIWAGNFGNGNSNIVFEVLQGVSYYFVDCSFIYSIIGFQCSSMYVQFFLFYYIVVCYDIVKKVCRRIGNIGNQV